MSETIFTKIINKEIPAAIVYEDEHVVAFRDIDPKAPVHVLIVPRKPVPTVDDLEEDDAILVGRMVLAAKNIAGAEGLDGYRLVINCKQSGGQAVYHLHLHLLGGRDMKWPPG